MRLLLALFCVLAPSAVFASAIEQPREYLWAEGGVLTYEIFEASVPHSDLDECPAEFDPDAAFCRTTLTDTSLNLFVFSLDGEQPLLAVKTIALDGGRINW